MSRRRSRIAVVSSSPPSPPLSPPSPSPAAAARGAPLSDVAGPAGPGVFQADIDGSRVRICARDEVVIQCGKASITLRRNGRVLIRGTYVETHSAGTNRIRGGQVRVN